MIWCRNTCTLRVLTVRTTVHTAVVALRIYHESKVLSFEKPLKRTIIWSGGFATRTLAGRHVINAADTAAGVEVNLF